MRYGPHVAKFVGTASVEDMAGNVVTALVNISLNDDPNECPYKTPAPWYGDMWLAGDLMIEPLRTDSHCMLRLSNGNVGQARLNSWDQGGGRAQLIGIGGVPFS